MISKGVDIIIRKCEGRFCLWEAANQKEVHLQRAQMTDDK